jgi:hypothetical protein
MPMNPEGKMDAQQLNTVKELDGTITTLGMLISILEKSNVDDGLSLLISTISSKKEAVSEEADFSTVLSSDSLDYHTHKRLLEAFLAAIEREFKKKKAEFHGIEINVPGYNEGAD